MADEKYDVEGKVKKIIAEQFGKEPGEITREITIGPDGLNADSLDRVTLIMEFEEAFEGEGLDIPDGEAEKLQNASVGTLIDYVEAKVRGEDYEFPE